MQDLSTELFWGSADENMPQEYLDGVMAQINAIQPAKPRPADYLDSFQRIEAIRTRNEARQRPREGQPSFDAPLIEWYREHQLRTQLFIKEMEELIQKQEMEALMQKK